MIGWWRGHYWEESSHIYPPCEGTQQDIIEAVERARVRSSKFSGTLLCCLSQGEREREREGNIKTEGHLGGGYLQVER